MGSHFVWDVDKIIFHIYGPLSLRWYSLMFVCGIMVAYYMFLAIAKREKVSLELSETLLYHGIIGILVGARLGHCLFYDPIEYLSEPWRILKVWEGGLSSHGGFLGLTIACYVFTRKHGKAMPFLWLVDRVSIVALTSGAFIRIGNFFNSEIIGRPSDLPWAIIFAKVDDIPRHPTQLYEAFACLCISLTTYLVYRYTNMAKIPGRQFGLSLFITACFRVFIETFKENQVDFENGLFLNMGQILSLPIILIGIALMLGWQKKFLKL